MIYMSKKAKANWDKIFGKWTPEKFRRALQEQKQRDRKAKKRSTENGPMVYDADKRYQGFDPGLQMHVRGKRHRQECIRLRSEKAGKDLISHDD